MRHNRRGRIVLVALVGGMVAACATSDRPSEDRSAKLIPAKESVRMGNASLSGGDAVGAINFYQQALKGKPDDYEASLGLADALMRSGESAAALKAYVRASEINPTAVEPLLGQGRIAIMQRRFADAQTVYNHAAELTGRTDPRPLVGLGTIQDLCGNSASAQELYLKALALKPDDVAARNNLGLSLALSGNPRAAVDILMEIVQSPSAPSKARHNLALAYGLMGNTDASENVLSTDLDAGSIQNDLRYYAMLRQRLAESPPPPAMPTPHLDMRAVPAPGGELPGPKANGP
ncbi:tetratricopeptide repeat protein [Magnetospirillum fulvum]|uniref:TPR repeat-containing protein n=1 Tax=Magnetospirillum fulvum MGU-K5 TaxID=1316936 RepID=S9S8Y2_MAGFU|nr:tetratricopeptide repeat protein [Magnetospirillum fulvum]EPY01124.1 TPR repeat-containing protein [Magnetospirillum fulvum MGU-K5]